MNRKLTLTMLLSLSAASPLALGLGLGDVEVRSTLDAPLRASIPLTDTTGLQDDLLNASVADPAAFQAAGLTRTPLAASVQLEVSRRQGQLVLDLATERAVREPWLDLLLRFDWPGGRQLHEVTLLLDPPNYAAMPVLIGSSRPGPVTRAAPTSAPASRRAVAPAMPSSPPDGARIRSGDTLWAVAGRLRPDSGISMNQMMLALVEANPQVFPSGNINQMRAGFTLVVPPREAIAARSAEAATDLVQAMNQAWANRGGGVPARVPLSAEPEPTAVAGASSPAAEAPTAGDEPADLATRRAEAAASGPRLTLLTVAEAADAGLGDGGGGDTAPASDGGQGNGQQASPRVRLDPAVLAAIAGPGELSEDQRLLRLERRWQENREALSAVQAERDALEAEVGDLRGELTALRRRVEALTAGGSGVDGAGAGGVVSPGSPPAEAPAPWWGALYQDTTDRPLLLGGAGLAALLALWALVRRRRRREEEPVFPFDEMQVAEPSGDAPAERPSVAAGPDQAQERPPVDPVRASMPQAEAINEADIFIAYGRYDRARELLEAGLAREPERDDLRLKLLKVQLEQGDRSAAQQEAQRLQASADTATRAEVEHLMARHAAPAASSAGERAVFPQPSELPPRVFSDPDVPEGKEESGEEEDEQSAPPASDNEADRGAARASRPMDDGEPDDLARYRPPEVDSGAEVEKLDLPGPAAPEEMSGGPSAEPSSEPPPVPGGEEPPMPQVTSRISEEGREIIDYRPPSLDEETPARQETPMQPSVDFPPAGGEAPGADDDLPSRDPSRREVESDDAVAQARDPSRREVGSDDAVAQARDPSRREVGSDDAVAQARDPSRREVDSDDAVAQARDPSCWEVEEVAFPPLGGDNGASSGAAPSTATLGEARQLIDLGEVSEARLLLERLLEESQDAGAREEARELLDRHQP
ncbi:FimV/HubP family polar landmark protein [Halomonas maura]|uniref:FimV/HubP family polar landmark protein n=1 Tax=Halomonas maura TaxID=117606 RepID=UPI0025B427A1|nr:FimV/HubP family polar landmark protein [Halomonas maura]MDN3554791.1 FimV/HubP family polar landmark protein [Halomonas maura]